MNKTKITTAITTAITLFSATIVQASGGSGDVGVAIDTWGNTFIGLALKVLRWGGIFSFIGLGTWLLLNNDETAAKRLKLGVIIALSAIFIGWFAQPIYNTFVK